MRDISEELPNSDKSTIPHETQHEQEQDHPSNDEQNLNMETKNEAGNEKKMTMN